MQPALAVILVPATAVLVGHIAPAEVGQRHVGHDPERLHRVDTVRPDGAQMGPVVAEIERIEELLARAQAREPRPPVIERWADLVVVAVRRGGRVP